MDPFSLLMLAQSTVAAIRSGCQMLADGKAEIDKFKKGVEGGVKDAKEIYGQVTGLWGWFKSLFGVKPAPVSPISPTESAPAKPTKKKSAPEPELSWEEYQAQSVHNLCEQLKQFFEIKRQLSEHCRELEEQSKTTADIEGSALDRIQIEMQIQNMSVQIREAMIYTPKEFGMQDIYSRFLKMYEQILEEREFDRQLRQKQEREDSWRQEYRRQIYLAKVGYGLVVLVFLIEMLGMYLTL